MGVKDTHKKTSIDVPFDLYQRVEKVAFGRGIRQWKEIVNSALRTWARVEELRDVIEHELDLWDSTDEVDADNAIAIAGHLMTVMSECDDEG